MPEQPTGANPAEGLLNSVYKPDVLECLSNLSNDEVFTPPDVANAMLDLLPQELFRSSKTRFLDPCCKSGVFLREIAKRLIEGLKKEFPDLQERLDHIFHHQLFGIAITELTALLGRRSVYCSKNANSEYSVSDFAAPEGNIAFKRIKHTWENGKCKYCGANKEQYDRSGALETHAYQFIHPGKVFENMKFDVIIGNPPYQLSLNEGGKGLGAIPIYQHFVEQALRLKPQFLTMIIPARWYAGGVGLVDFRKQMLENTHIKKIVDFTDSKECFPGVDINGGICYFLWDANHNGSCEFENITGEKRTLSVRKLNEFDIFIRRNEAISIIHKILDRNEKMISDGGCSPQTPYGFLSTYVGDPQKKQSDDCALLSSKGWTFVRRAQVKKSQDTIDLFKPMISKLSCEHAGNPDKSGMYRVLSRSELLTPSQICSQSYLTICPTPIKGNALNTLIYLKTKFVRFLILQTLVGMNISISNFRFVPWIDFSKPWTDEELYKKYGLSNDEIAFIESMIRPME